MTDLVLGASAEPLSFALEPGSWLGIVGPSGSGKTTLLKAVAGLKQCHMACDPRRDTSLGATVPAHVLPHTLRGLLAPASSRSCLSTHATLFGSSPCGAISSGDLRLSPDTLSLWQRRIGMVFQNNALFSELSIFENVAYPLRHRDAASDPSARVEAALDNVGLLPHRDKLPKALSGGMQKRVAIARATIARPELLLLDEPTAGLDPETTRRVTEVLRAAGESAQATLLVSNDVVVLRALCDHILMLEAGCCAFQGSTQQFWSSEVPAARAFIEAARVNLR